MVDNPLDVPQGHVQRMRWTVVAGWATWSWSVHDAEQKVHASYVGPEVLAAFMDAVRALLLGCTATFVTFFDEPNGTRLFLNQSADGKLFVQIVRYPILQEPTSWWSDARPVWAGRVPTEVFVGAFMTMIEDLLSEYGTAGYRRHWGYDFPLPEWAALQAAYTPADPATCAGTDPAAASTGPPASVRPETETETTMKMRVLIGDLMRIRTRQYLASSPLDLDEMPRLRPPATAAQIEGLQVRAGQPLDPEYRRFLSLTDGLDGFHHAMPLLGCGDWRDPERDSLASMFRDVVLETGPLTEVGLPDETQVFPIHVNAEGLSGILMLHHGDEARERFWWTGEGDNMFFRSFPDVIAYVTDGSYSPRHLQG
ncbi:SMI1/KNR4 family protein [Streptomyces sp. CO7]